MWKTITDLLSSVFTLTYRLEKQEQGLKDLQREVRELTVLVHRLAYEQQRYQERETSEWKNSCSELKTSCLEPIVNCCRRMRATSKMAAQISSTTGIIIGRRPVSR